MTSNVTLYAILGIAPDATTAEIGAAFATSEQSLQGNPDELSLLRVAYDTLRDPARRAAYDRMLARRQGDGDAALADAARTFNRRDRSQARWWILPSLAATVALLYVIARPAPQTVIAPTPKQTARVTATTPASEPLPATRQTPSTDTPAAIPEIATALASPPPAALDAAPSAPPAVPARAASKVGFDPQYLAWSVFTVRQRSLFGSGVLIAPDRILTNCHVLAGAAINGIAVIHSVTGKRSKVEKYARLEDEDACLLFAPGAGKASIAWGNSAALTPGDTLHTFGHPGGSAEIVWSEGRFLERVERAGDVFLFSNNYCRPGSSGGPLLDTDGRLVGIVAAVRHFRTRVGEPPRYGACISVSEAAARALLGKPLFPIALAPAQYFPNY